MERMCNCGCGPLIPGVNTTEGRIRARDYYCKASRNEKSKGNLAKYREKPENREKARKATLDWKVNNPEKYARKLELARKPK